MSNTGHKGVSASFDYKGEAWRFQVSVQWKGEILKATEYTLANALATRQSFEEILSKPRTEKHIRSNQVGVYLATDIHGNHSWVAQVGATRKHFAVMKYGRKAKDMAEKERKKMEEQQ